MTDVPHDPLDFARMPPPSGAATPFLDLDHDRLERNLVRMQEIADAAGVRLRPHIKTHKSVRLAKRQIAFGAVGVTASKPSEALVFVEGGIGSVTIAYPVVRPEAVDGLIEAATVRGAELLFILDSDAGFAALAAAGRRHGRRLPVFVKVDVGLGRAGVPPGSALGPRFATALESDPGTRFAGLLSHAGHAYGAHGAAAIADIARTEAALLIDLKRRIEAEGVAVPCLSVGSSPTSLAAPIPAGIDEIRPGNYAFLDGTALRLGLCRAGDPALSVVAAVVSRNARYAIVDAGSKALSSDRGPHGTSLAGYGIVVAADRVPDRAFEVEKMSEEHGFVPCAPGDLPVGSRVRIFPNHACATVASFDAYGPDAAASEWPVDARGRFR